LQAYILPLQEGRGAWLPKSFAWYVTISSDLCLSKMECFLYQVVMASMILIGKEEGKIVTDDEEIEQEEAASRTLLKCICSDAKKPARWWCK
jgi:hypothetical protein